MTRVLICIFLFVHTAAAAERIKRIAILDFRNSSLDRKFDSFKFGLAAAMLQELKRVPTLTLVDRGHMDDIMKEFRLGRSPLIKPGTAKQMGKVLGADSLLSGTYRISGNDVVINASITDVETSVVRVGAEVSGPLRDIFKLESDLARQLVVGIQGAPLNLDPLPDRNFDAFQMFSDGVYFFRNDHLKDALAKFDRALALDPDYVDAQFYRGLTLKKLQRWDEAIASFKTVLPRSSQQPAPWSWEAPFAESSLHGAFIGLDPNQARAGLAKAQKRILFGERRNKATIIYLPDLEHLGVQRIELPDEHIRFMNEMALANDRLTVFFSVDTSNPRPDKLGLYAVSAADTSLWWTAELPAVGGQLPLVGLTPDGVFTYSEADGRLSLFDDQTRRLRWTRDGVVLDKLLPPILSVSSGAPGGLMIAKDGNKYHAIRLSDGTDAWTKTAASPPLEIANDRVLVVFEPRSRFFAVDIETGNTIIEEGIPQSVEVANLGFYGTTQRVQAVIDQNALYVVSNAQELVAVDLTARRVQWKTPLNRKVTSLRVKGGRAYAGTETGELIVIDAAKGAILQTAKLAPRALSLDYLGDDIVIATADTAIFALDASGKKRWDYPSSVAKGVVVLKGIVAARTSATQITTFDAKTGRVLWQYVGQPTDGVHFTEDSFFIVSQTGIKKYAIDAQAPQGGTPGDKEVLTELAGALISKGARDEAGEYVEAVKMIDPDYPPLRLLLGDLATYANLVGRDSRAGQRAIAELKSKHGLLWAATMDGPVLGTPSMAGNRLVNVGRVAGIDARLVALDPASGATTWRLPSERFMDTVADDAGRLWYVSGQSSNPAGLTLYQVKIENGERRELARWSRPFPISAVLLAYASNRLFVATLSPSFQTNMLHAGIDCFDAVSGKQLWQKTHDITMTLVEMRSPIGLFVPQGENLVYSFGHEVWAVRSTDGVVLDQQREEQRIGLNARRQAVPNGPLYYPTTDRRELVAYDVDRKQLTRGPRPEMDSPQLTIRDGVLFGTANASVYAFDLKTGEKWRVPGKFTSVLDGEADLFALRDGDVLVQLDRSTGKIVREYPTLWRPAGFKVIGNRFYAITADGLAYSIKLTAP